jgi:putative inorganic carbon (hco3(-)) transporter
VAYFLFILVTATLFIRPSEVIPALSEVPIYYLTIVPCILVALPSLLGQLTGRSLFRQPITVCVLGMVAATALSHISRFNVYYLTIVMQEFPKVVLYYLLLVALVNTKARLRLFLVCLVVLTVVSSSLALVHYHGIVDIPACEPADDGEEDPLTGEMFILRRLCSSGIFHDPNDLCLILVTGMAICLYLMTDASRGPFRAAWLAPLLLFGYALTLTYSRGGFLALLASMLILFYARFGWKRTIPLAMVAVPAMFVLFGGRQTDLSTSGDTGQERIQVWTEGLALFRRAPLFGIGESRFIEEIGKVAHNSYVHAYTEMGFFGGTVFLSIYYLSLWLPFKLDAGRLQAVDPELRRLRPYLMALVAGYAIGLFSLSRNYVVPTYLYPGLISVYMRLASPDPSHPAVPFDFRLIRRLTLISLAVLIFLHVYCRLLARWG